MSMQVRAGKPIKAKVLTKHEEAGAPIVSARRKILTWYRANGREFPWRHTSNPYHILVAEMMLRRTQAKQVTGVYRRFVSKYPSIGTLSAAGSGELAGILKPLGLEWRNANFRQLAAKVTNGSCGKLPEDRHRLLAVKGIGPYVADSILCHAYGRRCLPVDVNIVRVLSRILGRPYRDSTRRSAEFLRIAAATVPRTAGSARSWHYALLDFAAMICRSPEPLCHQCPVRSGCSYYKNSRQRRTDSE